MVGILLRWVSPILDIQINLSKECGQNECIWGQISTNLFKTTFRYNFVAGYFWEKFRIFNCNKPIWSEKILLNILSLIYSLSQSKLDSKKVEHHIISLVELAIRHYKIRYRVDKIGLSTWVRKNFLYHTAHFRGG